MDYNIDLWDLVGADHIGGIAKVYYKHSVGAIIVCDAKSPKLIPNVLNWKEDIDSKVRFPNGNKIPMVLIANMNEDDGDDDVDTEKITKFCKQYGFVCDEQDNEAFIACVSDKDDSFIIHNAITDLAKKVLLEPGILVREKAMPGEVR